MSGGVIGCSLKSTQVWQLKWILLLNSSWHILRHSVHQGWEEVAQSWFLETVESFGVLHMEDSEHPDWWD